MTVVQFPKRKTEEELWEEYLKLSKKAQMTASIDDALKAKKAYQEFLESQNG